MRTHPLWLSLAAPLVILAVGCTDGTTPSDGGSDGDGFVDDRPAPVCNLGPGGFEGMPFVEVTDEMGLGADGMDATGMRLTGTDLDGDGFVDLVAIRAGGNARGLQRVYMNRPHPELPGRRVFEEALGTGIDLNRRTGIEGRSVNFHVAGDVDNDGDPDIFAGTYVSQLTDLLDRQEILLNDGTGHFSLLEGGSSVATVDPPADTTGFFFDYDRDGLLDLYVGGWYEKYGFSLDSLQDELYRGRGDGTFERVTEQAGLAQLAGTGTHDNRKPTYGLNHCDADGDGLQDILESAYGRQWNDLFLARLDGTFVNIGESSHFDADALTDYTDNQFYLCWCTNHPPCEPSAAPEVDCSARGWSTEDEAPFRQGGNTFGAMCADYDNDGDLDVFLVEISHGWAGSGADRSQLLRNEGGRGEALVFTRLSQAESGIVRERVGVGWNEGDVYAGWLDYNNDGLLDLLIHAGAYPGDRMWLFQQRADHTFFDWSGPTGLSIPAPHALVLADIDLDGDVDVIAGTGSGSSTPYTKNHVRVFENRLGQWNNWTRITLQGLGAPGGANRDAIGARVIVTSGDQVQTREVHSGAGQGGHQDELALSFGLGKNCADADIEVRWPNADLSVQRFTGVRVNHPLRIVEGRDRVEYLGL